MSDFCDLGLLQKISDEYCRAHSTTMPKKAQMVAKTRHLSH